MRGACLPAPPGVGEPGRCSFTFARPSIPCSRTNSFKLCTVPFCNHFFWLASSLDRDKMFSHCSLSEAYLKECVESLECVHVSIR